MRRPTVLLLACCAARAGAADHGVAIVGFAYEPATLAILEGDTVTIEASPTHPLAGDAGTFGCAADCTLVLPPGVHGYHCASHGAPGGIGMAGEITVVAAPPLFADGFEG